MSTVKERIIDIVNDQPEDSSYDDILKELAFDLRIQRGLRSIDEGKTVPHSEIVKEIEQWEQSAGPSMHDKR